jgi:peptidoglycan/xylan/chitin deacetylase (PgdA/CDA1 family)
MENDNRDFVGYGRHLPQADWPGGARLAINFVINYEEGSEYALSNGAGDDEVTLPVGHAPIVPAGTPDFAARSMFEYGSRVGFWRLYRLFTERNLSPTIFGCAMALERNPEAAAAIKEAGFDVCCHGWRWVEHYRLTEDEEREHIRLAVASIEKTVGQRPLGWYCRYGPSAATRRLLTEEGGFLYDSDAYNDELPYWTECLGQPRLVIPYSLTNNDGQFARGGFATADDFFPFCRDAFDMLYAEGAVAPRMMSVGLHCRLIGHPARAAGLARFLDYVAGFDDVWVARRLDIAQHWHDRHPPA